MQRIFDDNPNPSLPLRYELASAMGVKRKKIDTWFQYQRRKRRKTMDLSSTRTCKLPKSATSRFHKKICTPKSEWMDGTCNSCSICNSCVFCSTSKIIKSKNLLETD